MFFKKNFAGLDLREKEIVFASIKMKNQSPVLEDVIIESFDWPIFEGNRVENPEKVSLCIKNINKNSSSTTKQAHVAIPTEHSLVRKINTLPDLGENEIGKLLPFQIGESIHLPFSDPIYDFIKIGTVQATSNSNLTFDELQTDIESEIIEKKSEIMFFATSKRLSEDLMKVMEGADLKPKTAEIRGLSLQRLLNFVQPDWLKDAEMIVDISDNFVDIHIFKEEFIVFSRSMSISHQMYMVNKQQNEGEILWLHDPIDEKSRKEVAVAISEDASDTSKFDKEAYLGDLVNEIEKAQNFFKYSLGERDAELKRIIVTGSYAERLFEDLKGRFLVEVARINYERLLTAGFNKKHLLDNCSVAIGLAIRGNEKPQKKWKQQKFITVS